MSVAMKRYLVFAGTMVGTPGGACDFLIDMSSLKGAMNYRSQYLSLDRKREHWCHVWDTKDFRIHPPQTDEHGHVTGDDLA